MRPPPSSELGQSQLLRRLFALSAHYRSDCLQVFGYQVVLLVLGVTGLGLTGLAIDVTRHALDTTTPAPRWPFGFVPGGDWTPSYALFVIGALVLGMAAARAILNYSYAVAVGRLIHLKLVPELRTRVFDKLQRLSFRFFDENASGSIINRVTSDVQSVRSFVDGVLLQGAIMLLSLSVYMVYMLRTHAGLTLASLALTPLIWILTTRFSRWARPAYAKSRELSDEMVLAMSEGVHGIQVTKVFGREPEELARFRNKNHAVLEQQQEIFRRVSRFGPTVQFITHSNVAVLLIYGGYLVAKAQLSIGDLVVFAGLLQQFSAQISSMAGIINTLQQSLTGARRVFEVLDAPLEVESPPEPRVLPRVEGRIRFEHVSFAYEEGDDVLRDIDFEVAPGRCVAILGLTGAGKSTLLSLIPRFYDASRGRILIDDVEVKQLDLDFLRKNIGLVFQESLLFRNTVAQNIAFGHPEASREAIEHAARIAGADEFIRELPQGYDTVLEEAAVNLSGGQRQRIAIARALLLEPRILLLDDPTTAIDPETEREVLSAMDSAMEGRTTLVVANRLSTLRRADEILVLNDGRIVERGTHAELMAERGVYFRAASLQAADNESLQLLNALEEAHA
ncbi:MAG: ABC transporter ATP-binding protein [Myxococcota bacterium]